MTRTLGNGLKIPNGAVAGYVFTSDASGNGAWGATSGGSGGTPPFVQAIGDGTATTFTVTHGLGTREILVAVRETNTPYERILVSTTTPTTNTVFLDFTGSTAPTTNEFTVIITKADGGAVPEVTSLPGSPYDGQIVDLLVDSAGTYNGPHLWRCKYRSATSGASKWQIVGSSSMFTEIAALETTASTTFVALTTAGPSIAVPVAGVYLVSIGCAAANGTAGQEVWMSYDIGGTGAVNGDVVRFTAVAAVAKTVAVMRDTVKTLTAVTLTAKYKVGGGTGSFEHRWMRLTPMRIG